MLKSFSGILFLLLLSFCFVTGCAGQKKRLASDPSKPSISRNLYYIHSGDSTWIIKPVPSAGNNFSGLIYNREQVKKTRHAHIYADPLSAVKTDNGVLSVPMDNIVRVDNFRISAGMVITVAVILGLIFLVPVYL
jgi:hypothetical protein